MCDPVSIVMGSVAGLAAYSGYKGSRRDKLISEQRAAKKQAQEEADALAAEQAAELKAEKERLAEEQKEEQMTMAARERDEASKIARTERKTRRPKTTQYDTILAMDSDLEGKTLLGS